MLQVPGNEPYDWADDDSMSAEETMRRFEALGPEPTTGPAANYLRETAGTPVKAVITSSTVAARIAGVDTQSSSGASTITMAPVPPRPVQISNAAATR
jgi:hypothetical protein